MRLPCLTQASFRLTRLFFRPTWSNRIKTGLSPLSFPLFSIKMGDFNNTLPDAADKSSSVFSKIFLLLFHFLQFVS